MPRQTWQCPCGKRNTFTTVACHKCRSFRASENFASLVHFLQISGYKVAVVEFSQYRFAGFKGNGVFGGFATYGIEHKSLEGRLTADNRRCFNKWADCPMVVKIPSNPIEKFKLLKYLAFLGSKNGYKWSNDFGYLDNPLLPRDI